MFYYQLAKYCPDNRKDILNKSDEYHGTINSNVQEQCMRNIEKSTEENGSMIGCCENIPEKHTKENDIYVSAGTAEDMSWSNTPSL